MQKLLIELRTSCGALFDYRSKNELMFRGEAEGLKGIAAHIADRKKGPENELTESGFWEAIRQAYGIPETSRKRSTSELEEEARLQGRKFYRALLRMYRMYRNTGSMESIDPRDAEIVDNIVVRWTAICDIHLRAA